MSTELSLTLSRSSIEAIKSAKNLGPSTRFGIEKAWWRSGKAIHDTFNTQVLDKSAKSGRIYIRRTKGGARRRHQASAPGESPANRTGTYRKGFDFQVRGEHELVVGNTVKYSGFLELGTSRMRTRPGLGNAVDASQRDIMRNLTGEIEEAL